MSYTINKLAKLAGVSVRTLHYYDEIGLLKPSYIAENGYRFYKEKELIRLQQILFFRELEFPLESIKEMIDSKNFNPIEALLDQKKMIILQKKRLEGLIVTINNSIQHMTNQKKMKDEELYDSLSKRQMEEYQEEARQKWGHTEAYKQSIERTKNWTQEDIKRTQMTVDAINKDMVKLMDKSVGDDEVQAVVQRLYEWISQFYDCPMDIFRGLGQMYVQDPRFKANYDKYHPDLAQFTCDAMAFYADQRENPGTEEAV